MHELLRRRHSRRVRILVGIGASLAIVAGWGYGGWTDTQRLNPPAATHVSAQTVCRFYEGDGRRWSVDVVSPGQTDSFETHIPC